MGRGLRVLLALALLLGGAVVGAASAAVHGLTVGLVLALVASGAAAYALPAGWDTRLPFALGWLGTVLYASHPRPEGDYLVAGDTRGYTLLGAGVALLVFGLVTVRRPSPPPREAGFPRMSR